MKSLIFCVFSIIVAINAIPLQETIDWSNVVPVTELPGFWNDRDVKFTSLIKQQSRNRRIVGG
jgi:hypothetical protein